MQMPVYKQWSLFIFNQEISYLTFLSCIRNGHHTVFSIILQFLGVTTSLLIGPHPHIKLISNGNQICLNPNPDGEENRTIKLFPKTCDRIHYTFISQ